MKTDELSKEQIDDEKLHHVSGGGRGSGKAIKGKKKNKNRNENDNSAVQKIQASPRITLNKYGCPPVAIPKVPLLEPPEEQELLSPPNNENE